MKGTRPKTNAKVLSATKISQNSFYSIKVYISREEHKLTNLMHAKLRSGPVKMR